MRVCHLVIPPILFGASLLAQSPLMAEDRSHEPIEAGSIELREVLREAIKADAQRYPFGEIECVITRQNLEGPKNHQLSCVHSWWLNDKSFTVVRETSTFDPSFLRSHAPVSGVQTMEDSFEQTVSSGKVLLLNHEAKRARIALLSTRGKQRDTSVSPADFWFGKLDGQGRNCDWVLGPVNEARPTPMKRFDSRLLPDDKLEITATLADEAGSYRAVASMRSWKVLSMEGKFRGNGKPQTVSYTYTWDRGGTLLEKLVRRIKDGDRPLTELVYEVKRVDFAHRPPEQRFVIDESKIPNGYFVENTITKRQYWQGNFNSDLEKELDQMSSKLRSSPLLTR